MKIPQIASNLNDSTDEQTPDQNMPKERALASPGSIDAELMFVLPKTRGGDLRGTSSNLEKIFRGGSEFCKHLKFNLLTKEIVFVGGALKGVPASSPR